MTVVEQFLTDLSHRSGPLFHIFDPRSGTMVGCDCPTFHRLVLTWAERLQSTPDPVIMIFGRTTPMMMAAWFGSIVAGRLPAFLSYPSHKITPEAYASKLANYRNRFQSTTFVGEVEDRDTWPDVLTFDISMKAMVPRCPSGSTPGEADDPPLFLQCSSGTTGLQKAVMIRQSQLSYQINHYRQALKLDPTADRIVSWLPLYHDMGLVATFLLPLLTQTEVYYLDPFHWAAAPGLLLEAMERHGGTLTWLPNFAFSFLCKDNHRFDLSHVRAFINCSEPVSIDNFQRFMTTHGVLPHQLSVCYALAENVFAASMSDIGQPPRWLSVDPASLHRHRLVAYGNANSLREPISGRQGHRMVVSCGTPLPGVEIRIHSPSGTEIGEIHLRSPCTVAGYYQSDAIAQAGWFPTGDLGFIHDGELYLCGRKKDLIIQNGKNIYPQDVEAVLHTHPQVHPGRVAVAGMMDDEWNTQRTFALVETESNLPLQQRRALCHELQSRLTLDFDVLVQVAVVPRGWLRKTSSGKMAREHNLERYLTAMKDGIHLCGDSHVRLFWTNKTSHHNLFKAIHAYWVGLLWSDNWKKTIAFFTQLVSHMNPRDVLVIEAGEPECRSIFPAHAEPEARIELSVAGYREFFLFLKKIWPGRLAYMTGVPTAPRNGDNGDPQWPVRGDPQQRYRYQQQFYDQMQRLCAELFIHFIDVCSPLLGDDGMVAPESLVDGTHLNPSWISLYVERLEATFGAINLEPGDSPLDALQWDGSFDHFSQLIQKKVRDHQPLVDNPSWDKMVSSSLLDSLAIIELITMLNQVCGLNIEPGKIQWQDFESIESIYIKFVQPSQS
ncbi:MAG: AMP-binding protein [Magnetococcales bacterium]|nr:AMP-binding protein [Magnetococcales bacterium]